MITLPIDMAWLIVAVIVLLPALTFLAATEAEHHYTRAHRADMKAREKALNDRAVRVLQREHAVWVQELALGRAAHDASTQVKLALHQANRDDTMISIHNLEL